MKTRVFRVVPRIPDNLKSLETIAYNAWWTWNPGAVELFRRIDRDLWEHTSHNPVLLLGSISQERLEELSSDSVYVSRLAEVSRELDEYLNRPGWFPDRWESHSESGNERLIATFSAEFGLHESLPIYSGGLGVLAGDTLKAVSDLGLPMVGVSLLYRQGYFSQYLNSDGWQQERFFVNDYSNMPVTPVRGTDGNPVIIDVPMAGESVRAAVWTVRVGRTRLYLLDTCLPENDPEARDITGQLYGGDKEMRIRQEILLGVGGVRALRAMGCDPVVRHINEGHSGFLILELIRERMSRGLSFDQSREVVTAGNVFTTHTPVPAGNEEFHPDLVVRYLGPLLKEMDIPPERFLEFGSHTGNGSFSMTVFALRFSRFRNGVSQLHGRISRKIWNDVWPGLPADDVPIGHVTNGVHVDSWLSDEMRRLFDRYLGPRWSGTELSDDYWSAVDRIPLSELWRGHERLRERLVSFARQRWEKQIYRMGLGKPLFDEKPVLNPEVLTIGFARRFATYKRADLLLRDPDRLLGLLTHSTRPVQIVFAGKAHPHDHGGKELIRRIMHVCMKEEFYGRMIYLEDYGIDMARHLVQGVDIWLNTPRIPLEASGTSGMKACLNGVLHCSVPDGWWAEAYTPETGWSIGSGELYSDQDLQDQVEAKALYDLIENQIAPLFYHRGEDGLPRRWVQVMKKSIASSGMHFNSSRMLAEYTEFFYMPALELSRKLSDDSYAGARELATWKERIRSSWHEIRITAVSADLPEDGCCSVGDSIPVTVSVEAPGLEAADLAVEVQYGTAGRDGWIEDRTSLTLERSDSSGDSIEFSGSILCDVSGNRGFTVRVMPRHTLCGRIIEPGLVHWWEDQDQAEE